MHTEFEIWEMLYELRPRIESLGITSAQADDLELIDRDSVPDSRTGSFEVVLGYLYDSFSHLNTYCQVPVGWEVEIAVVHDHVLQGYLEIFWRLRMKRMGSIGVPHVVIRREQDWYEILLPEQTLPEDD